jgi:hypothetical protein
MRLVHADRRAPVVAERPHAQRLPSPGPHRVQRAEVPPQATTVAAPVTATIVDETEMPGPGQLRRSEFVQRARTSVCSAVDEELAGTGRSSRDCPYVERWLTYYRERPTSHLNRAVERFVGRGLRTADEQVAAIATRARRGAIIWRTQGTLGLLASGVVPTAAISDGSDDVVRTKATDPAAMARRGDPEGVRTHLGAGRALDAGVRARMEDGFGTSFSTVRIHDDANASSVARELAARAVTVGQDIAFARGQYRPGTLEGDALLAHELVHTMQQRGNGVAPSTTDDATLEAEADHRAAHVLAHLLESPTREPSELGEPRKTGLRLSGCPVAAGGGLALAGAGAGAGVAGGTIATGTTITLFGVTMTVETAAIAGTAIVGTGIIATEAVRQRERAEPIPRTIDIAPPIPAPREPPRPLKPLIWRPNTNVTAATASGGDVGGLDFDPAATAAVSIAGRSVSPGSSSTAFQWQGHHTWPMQYGGASSQPLMGVRQALHQGVIHPTLWAFLVAAGHDVSMNTGDLRNRAFITRLQTDLVFRTLVGAELELYYAALNTFTDPPIPASAYTKGITASLLAPGT